MFSTLLDVNFVESGFVPLDFTWPLPE